MFQLVVVADKRRELAAVKLSQAYRARTVWDRNNNGCSFNHYQAWQSITENSVWGVVLEDDALPVVGFRDQLEEALNSAPTPIVSLYLGRLYPPQWQDRIGEAVELAATTGACYITAPRLLHAVGVAIRCSLLPDLLRWPTITTMPPDEAITAWANNRGHRISYTHPSLVDHADGLTLVKHDHQPRETGRIAWATGGHTRWAKTTVDMT